MDKLKPCPFCGKEAMISYNSNYDFQAYCAKAIIEKSKELRKHAGMMDTGP